MEEFTVKEISKILSSVFKNAFPEMVAVTGEISEISTHNASGHIYFKLKEDDIILSATYFKQYHIANKFQPKLGDKVKVIGEIRTYEKTSSYQINVRKISYETEGALLKQFEEMKQKLRAEGLFDNERKRPIPKYPYRIAILTALSGAVIKDFIVTTKKEKGRYLADVWDIPVQNIHNAKTIADTIKKAGSYNKIYDVIVLMRGGGSLEDLSVFNQEIIARAISSSKVPVISAIGHETDNTIADFVADYRAATPTAAAVYLSAGYNNAYILLDKYTKYIKKELDDTYSKYSQTLDFLSHRLDSKSPQNTLKDYRYKIEALSNKLKDIMKDKLHGLDIRLNKINNSINKFEPNRLLEIYNIKVDNCEKSLLKALNIKYERLKNLLTIYNKDLETNISNYLFKKNAEYTTLHSKLILLDPKNVMDRGYAIVKQKEDIISSVYDVAKNKDIEIILKDGVINASPKEIIKNGNEGIYESEDVEVADKIFQ